MTRSILLIGWFILPAHLGLANDEIWYREPFRIQAGDKSLDIADPTGADEHFVSTTPVYAGGHAAPFLVDLSGCGRRDLVVGGLGNRGTFRRYRNRGSDAAPRFDADYTLLSAGDKPAQVPIGCCIGAGAFFADLDGSGVLGFVSGGYDPGFINWFRGIPGIEHDQRNFGGVFAKREMLLDELDQPTLPRPLIGKDGHRVLMTKEFWNEVTERGIKELIGGFYFTLTDRWSANGVLFDRDGRPQDGHFLRDQNQNMGWSTAALVNWYNEEWPQESKSRLAAPKLDLIVGTFDGRIFVFKNVGARDHPVFSSKPFEITIHGEKAIPQNHAGVTVADWDGDGLFDIVVGGVDGSVYLLHNSGKLGAPEFNSREVLLGPGEPVERHAWGAVEQWLERGETPRRGGCAQIQVVDYNRDGKPDILVGDWSITITPRSDLSPDEEKEMRALHTQMQSIIDKYGGNLGVFTGRMYQSPQGQKDRYELDQLRTRISPYLEKYDTQDGLTDSKVHGFVWVYLHK